MVDFNKRRAGKGSEKKTDPLEIYDSLDRKSETGPLRPAQAQILSDWYSQRRDDKDLIIKLHTGQGKTLIGLLILQSRLNEGRGPALYLCPNIYLVHQTFEQANKFGIRCCLVESDGQIPYDFLNGNKILITHIQKVFNGLTKFKLGSQSIQVDTVILDDSHACIDSIKDALSLKIPNASPVYNQFLALFESDLKNQGEGSFLEILNGERTTLPVPYWSWNEKQSDVLNILSHNKEEDSIKFTWPLIKDNLENCQAFISGQEIEITQYIGTIWQFGTFHNAKQRILMSATTLDDSFFIKGLSIDAQAVEKPLMYQKEKWSGEKMILIPSLIDHNLNRTIILNYFGKTRTNKFGIAAITPSFKKTKIYGDLHCVVTKSDTIYEEVKKMKGRKETAPVVFVNRYDGIDLPDDACRVLILDSKPISESLADLYEESCRSNSDIINIKTAQKIEQGLGRSVRGEKDYSAIILVGADLVNFIKGTRTRNLFSSQTQKQIEIGFEISRLATEELTYNSDTLKEFASLVNQCLGRDEGWKGFYSDEMESLGPNEHRTALIDILKLEREAEYKFFKRDYEGAVRTVQKIIDKIDEPSEKGWYLQIMARYQYKISKVESNRIQKGAFLKNHALLNPVDGVSYDKLSYINEDRISRIKDYVREFPDYSELFLEVNHNCSNISYTSQAEVFEESLKTIGKMLGFLSQRPDKEFKRGPDNLWCCGDNEYILFECKNEVDEKRTEISKTEAAQLNTSIAWFEQEYTSGRVLPMMVIHTKNLAKNASLESKAKIMRKESLYALRRNIKNFYKEFKDYEIHNVSDKNISEFLTAHKLDIPSLKKTYCEDYYHKKV